ncbi:hypothetical protein B0J11DRAFT_296255 [Dendryphion nanum]|uniref:Uncharacterized protein n=1 Tax=Dendryphion nanum TaxID=256645 RepID=A0A9P9DXM9_9PLEO|nr:hypothetical protein B0J11DRAFT_296255 [Dendryphion nanum]
MGVGETITVINKSGKVVKSSRHIVDVLKEARSAYRERKAEIEAERKAALQEKKLREGIKTIRLDDNDDTRSRASSHHSKRSRATHRSTKSHRHPRPPLERGFTDSFYANDDAAHRSHRSRRYEQDLEGEGHDAHRQELTRRHTAGPVQLAHLNETRRSAENIDMDLAYGDVPPPLPVAKKYDDGELREKASALTRILDEANCLQHSATTTIDSLQKNPDALAAVGLALAEISTLVTKMGPSVLPLLKTSFPAVAALLISPQFMIAAGVGIGVTIVALGGYKIIKKIQAQKEEERAMEVPFAAGQTPAGAAGAAAQARAAQDEPYLLDELETRELSRIEMWRRGIADVEASSAGTTVDGEYITPGASRQLVDAGVLDADDLKSRRSARLDEEKSQRAKTHRAKSVKSSKSTSKSTTSRSKSVKPDATKSKSKKEPSLLKTLLRSHTAH